MGFQPLKYKWLTDDFKQTKYMDEEVKVSIENTPYQVSIEARDHRWLADEPYDVGGDDTGPNPGELLLSSLGSCT
ncbi:MAG TPA: hypothetical protein VM802_29610, partial [Chitinophaga sp.]|uniref:OsmC family protein n=1 Tax=Chitinophaga sp. TaxID=1869181 RepID=UPI002C0096A4|nr:hypothetical protein [Chitinophaga sp.]